MKKLKKLLVCLLALSILSGCAGKKDEKASEENSDKKIKVGVLQFMEHVSLDAARQGFEESLKEDGIDYELIYKNVEGDISIANQTAVSLRKSGAQLIYAIGTPAAQAAQTSTEDLPIIFCAVTDPKGAGLVENEKAPEKNISGVSDYISPKEQLESFLKIFPDVKTIGTIYNIAEQNSQVQVEELKKVCQELGLTLEVVGVQSINDIPQSIASLSKKIDAFFALTDNLVANAAPIVSENLLKYNLPSISAEEGQVSKGLLISDGVVYEDLGKQAGHMAAKVLKGEKIENLPVETYKNHEIKINKKTAEKLGLDLNNQYLKNAVTVGE